jgi:hypothetical protein
VRHIMTKTKADTHRITRFAVIDQARVFYPSTPPPHAQNS